MGSKITYMFPYKEKLPQSTYNLLSILDEYAIININVLLL